MPAPLRIHGRFPELLRRSSPRDPCSAGRRLLTWAALTQELRRAPAKASPRRCASLLRATDDLPRAHLPGIAGRRFSKVGEHGLQLLRGERAGAVRSHGRRSRETSPSGPVCIEELFVRADEADLLQLEEVPQLLTGLEVVIHARSPAPSASGKADSPSQAWRIICFGLQARPERGRSTPPGPPGLTQLVGEGTRSSTDFHSRTSSPVLAIAVGPRLHRERRGSR